MEGQLIYAGLFALGGLGYALWGFIDAIEMVKKTPERERFSMLKFLKTIIPVTALSFGAAMALPEQAFSLSAASMTQAFMALSAGYGWASAQRRGEKYVVSNFFDVA